MTDKTRIYIRDFGEPDYRMLAVAGQLSMTGNEATFRRSLRLPVRNDEAGEPGLLLSETDESGLVVISDDLLLLTGYDGYLVLTTQSNFRANVTDADLKLSIAAKMITGEFALSGAAASLARQLRLEASPGAFVVSASDIVTRRTLRLPAVTSNFTLTGGDSSPGVRPIVQWALLGSTDDVAMVRRSASFADAANGGAATGFYSVSSELSPAGIEFDTSTGEFAIAQALMRFNLDVVPGGISAVSLSLKNSLSSAFGSDIPAAQTLEVRRQDFTITSPIEATLFKTASELETMDFLGSGSNPNSGYARYSIPLNLALLPRGGAFGVNISPAAQRSPTPPVGTPRYYYQYSRNRGGSDYPYLIVSATQAWVLVGAGVANATTSASHTLAEPAGVEEGDLLVASISIRSSNTGAVTLPPGWQLATSSYINNVVVNNTTGACSGLIAYTIRGSSAPSLTFTHPAAPSVAIGQIMAYRNNVRNIATVLDVAAATRMGAANTAISVPGLVTTERDTLIVSAVCGGRNISVSNFDNDVLGSPSGTSSASTVDPSPNVWLERGDTGSASGAGTGLAIYDSLRTYVGDTGNMTATASASALHLVLRAAFRLLP